MCKFKGQVLKCSFCQTGQLGVNELPVIGIMVCGIHVKVYMRVFPHGPVGPHHSKGSDDDMVLCPKCDGTGKVCVGYRITGWNQEPIMQFCPVCEDIRKIPRSRLATVDARRL